MQPNDTDKPQAETKPSTTPEPSLSGRVPVSPAVASGSGIDGIIKQLMTDAERHSAQSQAEIGSITDRMRATTEARSAVPMPGPLNIPARHPAGNADIMKAFGQPAAVFGMFASLLARRPLTAAIKSASAAMQGYAAGNKEAVRSAEQAWRDNLDISLKQHDHEWRQYQAAVDRAGNDIQALSAELQAVAAANQDQKAMMMLNAGLVGDLLQYKQAEAGQAARLQEHLDTMALRQKESDRTEKFRRDELDATKTWRQSQLDQEAQKSDALQEFRDATLALREEQAARISPSDVAGPLLRKMARNETLSPGEQRALDAYQKLSPFERMLMREGGGFDVSGEGAAVDLSSATSTATGADGQKIYLIDGQWVDESGEPVE